MAVALRYPENRDVSMNEMRDVWDSPLFISFCKTNGIFDQIRSILLTFSADGRLGESVIEQLIAVLLSRHQSVSKMGAI